MTVASIGGGPAGLFLSILLKTRRPDWDVAVYEQNPRGNTFGWGIVFSDGTMENLRAADEAVARETEASLAHWDDIEVRFQGEVLRSSGHGFIGVGRHRFLEILGERAEAVGVRLLFDCRVEDPAALGADLVVASDGVHSAVRARHAEHFRPTVEPQHNRYTWLGTHRPFEAFTFDFQETEHGWFQAHCYQFSERTSTFIVECTEATWHAAGLDRMAKPEGLAFCEALFRDLLDGHGLLDNAPHLEGPAMWLRFPKVTNETWHHGNVVLLGDAAATAHFSIGSGTKLALESAIALADRLTEREGAPLGEVLDAYEEERRVEVLKLQNAARNSTEWFESVRLRAGFAPEQFAYSLLTRSQRVSHENLRLRDPAWLEGYEQWWAAAQAGGAAEDAVPPMFVPLPVRGLTLPNRVAVSPMAMYSAEDGVVNDFHLVHLGQRALGGAGLVFTEMTCVAPDARITPGCAGLWTEAQAEAYARIVDFIHTRSPAKAALQLGHAGPKGSVQKPWEAPDDITPLDDGNWPLLGPSALPYSPKNQTPKAMDRADMDRVRDQFVAAARRGAEAGFDWLELHCAHGYLLSAFLSPLTNGRTDEYGGPVENRVRYPLEVFDALRAVWPEDRPMSVRISAVDWVDGGNTVEDAVAIARAFEAHGADLIDVSTGQVSKAQQPVYGRMYQTPFAERIRLETGAKVMAVGNIYEPDHVNSILAAGRADLCLLARPHLWNPHWMLFAAAELAYDGQWWPPQYQTGRRQIERIFERQKAVEG
ncbi:MAG: bifunctional salicylyl-CoA 5-hydroxylase/oxidoreductase [Rubricoccaceae bacterium]|nr:bifunctional salicylyl-CoA 5-hydroxylase/oxidoreductase [Rubricoccaceae bacterium]